MKVYKVYVNFCAERVVDVDAESEDEACTKAYELVRDEGNRIYDCNNLEVVK